MSNNYVSGINEPQVKAIINRITSNIEKLESKFIEIDTIFSNNKQHYDSESALLFRKKYDNIRLNYDIIKKNLLSYVEDLTALVINYKKLETDIVDMVNTFKPLGED